MSNGKITPMAHDLKRLPKGRFQAPGDLEHLVRSPTRQLTFIFTGDPVWSISRKSVQLIRHHPLGLIFKLRSYYTPSADMKNVDVPRRTPLHCTLRPVFSVLTDMWRSR